RYAEKAAASEAQSVEILYRQYLSLAEESEAEEPAEWALEKVRAAVKVARFEIYTVPNDALSPADTYPKTEFRAAKLEYDYLGRWTGRDAYAYRIFVRPEFIGAFGTTDLPSLRQRFGLFGLLTFLLGWTTLFLWSSVRRRRPKTRLLKARAVAP